MKKLLDLEKLKENFYAQFAVLLGTVFILWGKPVPYSNETSYLLRLVKVYRPDFLLNDITFATPANEHWFFDHIFGLLTLVFSLEFIGWTGRILCWTALLYALIKLGRNWKISLWLISFSIFLWLCLGQSIVADEWMIGNFEAKCIAYICFLFALDLFCKGREILPAILLGLTFSFHPAVGFWGIPATILALAISRWDFVRILKITFISGVFSLFGLIPLLFSEVAGSINTAEDWKFFVLVGYPFHYDPFVFAKSSIILLVFLMAFCFLFYLQNRTNETDKTLKFFTTFLAILFIFFCAGIILRIFGQFELLRLMPMRLFPVFAPLIFLFSLAKAYQQKVFVPPAGLLMIIGLLCLLGWISPFSTALSGFQQTIREWRTGKDNAVQTFIWLKNNTPNGTVVIAPPWRKDVWYYSERAQIINYGHAPVSNLGEWQMRLDLLVGKRPLEKSVRLKDEMEEFYNNLTADEIGNISKKYNAQYLVTEADYSFPVAFQSGKFKVYQLNFAE
jgi:hypothetical protein